MKHILTLIVLVFIGCVNAPPYKRAGEHGTIFGYKDQKITNTSYRISYKDADENTAYTKMLMRAAEISLKNGFKYFSMQDQETIKELAGADVYFPIKSATIKLLKVETQDSFDAKEVLDNNPLPIGPKP